MEFDFESYAISAYRHYICEFESCSWRGAIDTTLCDEVCLWPAAGWWFIQGIPVSSTNISEILLKVALNTIILELQCSIIYHIKLLLITSYCMLCLMSKEQCQNMRDSFMSCPIMS